MSKKERMVEELISKVCVDGNRGLLFTENVADFILARDERILGPLKQALIKTKNLVFNHTKYHDLKDAIEQALKEAER